MKGASRGAWIVGFWADGIQASEKAFAPEGTGDVVHHMYAVKIMRPAVEGSVKLYGVVGLMAAYVAATPVMMVGLPGIVAGEYAGKVLYKPTAPQPSSF